MEIRTNNVPRWMLDAFELTSKEKEQFDYLPWEAIDKGEDSANFFRFKGQLYDVGEFLRTDAFPGWDASRHDSAFSGIVIKLVDDERLLVGQYFS